jgi:hypothetical protein
MPETSEEYRKRLAENLGEQDPISVQRETPRKLARVIRGMSIQQLAARPSSGKWSIVEILAHLAEDQEDWKHSACLV